ncbi:MAG: Kazal-type serine protease inhibitor family protein [Myxococcota bacterium]
MRLGHLAAVAALVACATNSYEREVPRCLPHEPAPDAACLSTDEVSQYQARIADALLQRLRWQHPPDLAVHVRFAADPAVEAVCMGDASNVPAWNVRAAVARGLPELRQIDPVPGCLAGRSLDVTEALVAAKAPEAGSERFPDVLQSCLTLRNPDFVCVRQYEPVCGVSPDGTRRTYSNACDACDNSLVRGYTPGPCTPR